MDRDTALEKVKKCLALAGSSNPHEAAAAMRQAQKLMQLFDISETDISISDVKEEGVSACDNSLRTWEAAMANMIAAAFSCGVFVKHGQRWTQSCRLKRFVDWTFYGVGAAPTVAAYAFKVLSRQCLRDRQVFIATQSKRIKQSTKTARGDAFAMAWVHSVQALVDRLADNERNDALLAEYIEKTHPAMGEVKPPARHLSRYVNSDSYVEGARAGRRARLEKGVGSTQNAGLIT